MEGFGSIEGPEQSGIDQLCSPIEEEMQGADRSCKTEAQMSRAPGRPLAAAGGGRHRQQR